MKRLCLILLFVAGMAGACAEPEFRELKSRIRTEHPRMFLTGSALPEFRRLAVSRWKKELDCYRREVDALSLNPVLELKEEYAGIENGRLVFRKPVPGLMQNDAAALIRDPGGFSALKAAILYLATGEAVYLRKAKAYLNLTVEFIRWSDRYRIMPEWWHTQRLSALIAYDWLHGELSPEERRAFILPVMRHVEHVQNPGYQVCRGAPHAGNYGEPGLLWYAGLAGFRDGVDDALAERLLEKGYRINCRTMEYRERISAGSGLLGTTATGYSFGFYPHASFNFIRTLRSAAGIDASAFWPQMERFAAAFLYQTIPTAPSGYLCYGLGDEFHRTNRLANGQLYLHMASMIDLYRKTNPRSAAEAVMVIASLPERQRSFLNLRHYPFLPFILFQFDPAEPGPSNVQLEKTVQFPAFGLTFFRSGNSPADTFAVFKGGAFADNHQHYDENHFILYKNGFQALDSGERGPHRHHQVYYPQTVAHNSILIRQPGELLPSAHLPANARSDDRTVFNDGGQRYKKRAVPVPLFRGPGIAAAGADATGCYGENVCREAVRQFVWIEPDLFIVYDRVESANSGQEKVFLLHTQNRPERKNGFWLSRAGKGTLLLKTVLPRNAAVEVIGGAGNEFRTNGRNWELTNHRKVLEQPNWFGRFRFEIREASGTKRTVFLHVLQVGTENLSTMVPVREISEPECDGVEIPYCGRIYRVLFRRSGAVGGRVTVLEQGKQVYDRPLPGLAERNQK